MQKIHSLSLLLFISTASAEGCRNQNKNTQPSPPLNTDLQAIQTNSSNIVNAEATDSTTQASSSDIAPEKPIAPQELPRVEDIAPESIPKEEKEIKKEKNLKEQEDTSCLALGDTLYKGLSTAFEPLDRHDSAAKGLVFDLREKVKLVTHEVSSLGNLKNYVEDVRNKLDKLEIDFNQDAPVVHKLINVNSGLKIKFSY